MPLAVLPAEMSRLLAVPRAVTSPTLPRSARRQHIQKRRFLSVCLTLRSMEATKGNIAIVADSTPAKTAGTATEILAAALSELLSEAKRQTALLEALVERSAQEAQAPRLSPVAGPAAPSGKPATSPAAAAPVSSRSHKAVNGGNGSSSSHACFGVEELRARARAHNHLLDTDCPKSRAILALLRDDGTVPDHFPVCQHVIYTMRFCQQFVAVSILCVPSSRWFQHAWHACGLS